MRKGDWNDPLLRQAIPDDQESMRLPGFVNDPVNDGAAEVLPGLLHKYQGRVLMIATGACAIIVDTVFDAIFHTTPLQNQTPIASGLRLPLLLTRRFTK